MIARRAFPNKLCIKCGKCAELLNSVFAGQHYYCWQCFGMPRKIDAKNDREANEKKHMGASVRFAWSMVGIANERLNRAGLPTVMSPTDIP